MSVCVCDTACVTLCAILCVCVCVCLCACVRVCLTSTWHASAWQHFYIRRKETATWTRKICLPANWESITRNAPLPTYWSDVHCLSFYTVLGNTNLQWFCTSIQGSWNKLVSGEQQTPPLIHYTPKIAYKKCAVFKSSSSDTKKLMGIYLPCHRSWHIFPNPNTYSTSWKWKIFPVRQWKLDWSK